MAGGQGSDGINAGVTSGGVGSSSSRRQPARVVTLHTTAGEISVELYDAYAPRLCENFFQLATTGKYNNTVFHRLVPGCFIQGGDTNGKGGESATRSFVDDEFTPHLSHTGAGIVSSASAGPDLNASQFLITLSPQPRLDGVCSIFGRVSFGISVLQKIALWGADPVSSKPYQTLKITHCSWGEYPRQRRPVMAKNNTSSKKKRAREDESDPMGLDHHEDGEGVVAAKCALVTHKGNQSCRGTTKRASSAVERLMECTS